MIAVPCMDTVQTEFVQSLVNLQRIGQVRHEFKSCSLIYKSRTDLGEIAIKEKSDYVLWIDSDMVFSSDLLIDMVRNMEEGRDIVTGICHMRRPPFLPVIWSKLRQGLQPDENESEVAIEYPEDEPFEIEGCGFGCVMMKTEVLEAVKEKYHELFAPVPGFGEDLSFCLRARGCGYRIWCDPRIEIGHKASTIVTTETFRAYAKANPEMIKP